MCVPNAPYCMCKLGEWVKHCHKVPSLEGCEFYQQWAVNDYSVYTYHSGSPVVHHVNVTSVSCITFHGCVECKPFAMCSLELTWAS